MGRFNDTEAQSEAKVIHQEYKNILVNIATPWCFWCGRGLEHRPNGWFAPWLIERAHIVNKPRVEDRRAVILLCSWCHKVQHGEQLVLPGVKPSDLRPSLSNMLWLKKYFDPEYYDWNWLNRHSVGQLPAARCSRIALANYCSRRQPGTNPESIRA